MLLAGGCLCISAAADQPAHAIDTEGKVESLPAEPGPHWIWVYDAALSSMPDGRAHLLDAGSGRTLGTLNTGYSFAGFALPRTYTGIYSAETWYSRHVRGTRTDLVSIYDPQTLSPKAEILLPAKRASTIPRLNDSALSDDDRFLAVFNLTPATSLSIVDVQQGNFIAEAGIPGCSLAFPVSARAFFSLCFNGTALLTTLNDDGSVARQDLVERFFDSDGDFIADHGARRADTWYFPSLHGNLYALEYSGGTLKPLPSWPLLTPQEAKAGWRISGLQGESVHAGRGEFYFLVHRGAPETYKDPGTEVWVYDLDKQSRTRRIKLRQAASAIAVSADDEPVLATLSMEKALLDIYSAAGGRYLRRIEQIGITPALLQFPWRPDSGQGATP
jgi:methylamine dehydrogenase heavy chain